MPAYDQHTPPYWLGAGSHQTTYPSHVTHSWQQGFGGDPIAALAKAIDRLAAAIEQANGHQEVKPEGEK